MYTKVAALTLGTMITAGIACPESEYEWVQMNVDGPPAGGAAMAYDSIRQRIMVYTGYNTTDPHGQLWSWDGTEWNLESQGGPSRRNVQAIAYDSINDQLVLFGGWDSSSGPAINKADTWFWDGSAWHDATPTGTNPSGRRFNALSYDEMTEQVIMFGGIGDGCNTIKQDTWAWDGARWSQVSDLSNLGLVSSIAVYDSSSLSTVRFGGQMSCSGTMTEVFQEKSGTGWETIETGGMMPSLRKNAGLAPIGHNKDLILFGGSRNTDTKNDTWRWDGSEWTELQIPAPPARGLVNGHFGMAYDEARNEIVLFGGEGADGASLGDTWVLRSVDNSCPSDLSKDGIVDNGDIIKFIEYIFAGNPKADMNCDGINDNGDISAFVEAFLAGCQ